MALAKLFSKMSPLSSRILKRTVFNSSKLVTKREWTSLPVLPKYLPVSTAAYCIRCGNLLTPSLEYWFVTKADTTPNMAAITNTERNPSMYVLDTCVVY